MLVFPPSQPVLPLVGLGVFGILVGTGVKVAVDVGVSVAVGVAVAVSVGVAVLVAVAVFVAVAVAVNVGVGEMKNSLTAVAAWHPDNKMPMPITHIRN